MMALKTVFHLTANACERSEFGVSLGFVEVCKNVGKLFYFSQTRFYFFLSQGHSVTRAFAKQPSAFEAKGQTAPTCNKVVFFCVFVLFNVIICTKNSFLYYWNPSPAVKVNVANNSRSPLIFVNIHQKYDKSTFATFTTTFAAQWDAVFLSFLGLRHDDVTLLPGVKRTKDRSRQNHVLCWKM